MSRPQRLARPLALLVILAATLAALTASSDTATVTAAQSVTTIQVYATGFVNPKGMTFTPDRTLYVAEAGAPGEVTVALPSGYGGNGPIGRNGRVSRIRPGGQREDFLTNLPNVGIYGGVEMLGAASVAVLDGQLYELAAAHMTVSPTLSRVAPDGTMTVVADIGEFNKNNPPPPSNGDALPTGNPYDLVAMAGSLYITDGNYNRVLKWTPGGQLSVLAAWENSPVTVGAAAGPDGNLYVAQFSPEPYLPGTARVDRITPDGKITEGVVKNLSNAIDVAFAPDGTMYVLQFVSQFDPARRRYAPFGGFVLRVRADATTEPVVTGLAFPTSMTFGPDGALYVNNYGNEGNDGRGQVLRVIPGAEPARGPELPPPADPKPSGPVTSRSTPSPTPAVAPPAGGVAATIAIIEPSDVQQWGYEPKSVTIRAGESVTFTNRGQVAHTATASNGGFDSGLVKGGESVTLKIDRPGTLNYFCQPHPWMKATILVQGEGGVVPPEAVPVANTTVSEKPPTISPLRAAGFVGLIIAGVFAAGYAMRRRTPATDMSVPPRDR